jgi:hypothetical protein
MLSKPIEMHDRRETLINDARVREQGSTFLEHTHDTAGGRFAQIGAAHVVALPAYPAASPHQYDPCGTEPPLGYAVGALEPLEASSFTQGSTDPTPTPTVIPSVAPASVGSFSRRKL